MPTAHAPSLRVLLLPGWQNSGPSHWQSRWENLHGYLRVEQGDWFWPKRGDWMARLEEVILQSETPAVLVGHSLGCQLAASWSAHSQNTALVKAALLVAPPDPERDDTPPQLYNWRPITRERLRFTSLVVTSTDDPFSNAMRATAMADAWGSELALIGARGHINGDSGLGDWAEGHAMLRALVELAV